MSRGLTLGVSLATRGLRERPSGGIGRATRGYSTEGIVAATEVADPPPLISSTLVDSNGTPRLVSDKILGTQFIEVYRTPFWHPDREYTGYAANGLWYTNGLRDPSHSPYQASWAAESASTDRGVASGFPRRMLVILTDVEVCLMNADTLDVWMRFLLPRVAPPALGPFLGVAAAALRSVDFSNGFLIVATDGGLRIADFRRDVAYSYRSGGSNRSTLAGLASRNSSTYMDGSGVPISLSTNDQLKVSAEHVSNPSGTQKNSYTLAVSCHDKGFCGITLDAPAISYPTIKNTTIQRTIGSNWSVDDDGDGDTTSPYFIDAGTNWLGFQVSEGDTLITDALTTHTIVSVDQVVPGSRLKLTPELSLSATGTSYVIRRRTPAAKILPNGTLYLANGDNKVTYINDNFWYYGPSPVFSNLESDYPTSKLNTVVSAINDLAVTSTGDAYIATSLGIFYAPVQGLYDGSKATFTYSSVDVTEVSASYKILVGSGRDCPAVGIDPETGNVIVALNEVEGSWIKKSVVTEINPNIHQAFRFFDKVGVIRSFATYRNPSGPPDKVS